MNAKMKHALNRSSVSCYFNNLFRGGTLLTLLIASFSVLAPNMIAAEDDNEMINKYFSAQNSLANISFDASNIKQFWVDNSVMSKDGLIYIFAQKNKQNWQSVPLSIQLANVDESLDCTISVLTDNQGLSFSILNSKSKVLAKSSKGDDFLQYHLATSSLHLSDIRDCRFALQFESNSSETISIKKIVLSFSKNKNGAFLSSPDTLVVTKDSVTPSKDVRLNDSDFIASGKTISLISEKNILVPNNEVKSSVTIQNVGETAAKVSVGYSLHSKDGHKLGARNYPYSPNSNVLTVVSSKADSNIIIVEGTSDWTRKCSIVSGAKEDLSDIPNESFVDGRISAVKGLENGQMEITLDAPLKEALNKGEKIRIHGIAKQYLFTNAKTLQPGEKETFVSTIKKNVQNKGFDSDSIPFGVYYLKPMIQSNSVDAEKDNTIQITDYSVSF